MQPGSSLTEVRERLADQLWTHSTRWFWFQPHRHPGHHDWAAALHFGIAYAQFLAREIAP